MGLATYTNHLTQSMSQYLACSTCHDSVFRRRSKMMKLRKSLWSRFGCVVFLSSLLKRTWLQVLFWIHANTAGWGGNSKKCCHGQWNDSRWFQGLVFDANLLLLVFYAYLKPAVQCAQRIRHMCVGWWEIAHRHGGARTHGACRMWRWRCVPQMRLHCRWRSWAWPGPLRIYRMK